MISSLACILVLCLLLSASFYFPLSKALRERYLDRLTDVLTYVERQADAVLFGHTHKPFVDIRRGVAMLNPGSVGSRVRPTYGTLDLSDGQCLPATHLLPL